MVARTDENNQRRSPMAAMIADAGGCRAQINMITMASAASV
jgi:hypothetical protein